MAQCVRCGFELSGTFGVCPNYHDAPQQFITTVSINPDHVLIRQLGETLLDYFVEDPSPRKEVETVINEYAKWKAKQP